MSFLQRYIDVKTGALLPGHSGWDFEDVVRAVLKDMFNLENKETDDSSLEDDTKKNY